MFHLAAYFGAGSDAGADIAALPDDIVTIQNNHFVLSQPLQLIAAQAAGDELVRARLASPSMRQIAPPFIRPINTNLVPFGDENVWFLDFDPFTIRPFEEIQTIATNTSGQTDNVAVLLWLADAIAPLPSGNIIPLRWTSSGAAVADAWTTLTIAFDDTLPAGAYAMVLSEHNSATAMAHRWIVPNQYWRPGYPSMTDSIQRLPYPMSKGQFGLMGRFRSNDLPRPQVLCDSADNAHEGYLHVIRIGDVGIPYGPF